MIFQYIHSSINLNNQKIKDKNDNQIFFKDSFK